MRLRGYWNAEFLIILVNSQLDYLWIFKHLSHFYSSALTLKVIQGLYSTLCITCLDDYFSAPSTKVKQVLTVFSFQKELSLLKN